VLKLAVKLGVALHCNISQHNYFARKNYFYPDLPKGYQVSQDSAPICKGGYLDIQTEGAVSRVLLNRIHMEEDAGKSIHDANEKYSCIDLNRAGTPLLEIVTEPCIHSSDAAFQFLTELRKLLRWINVCDGNMEEGSMRCDANISIMPKGSTVWGTKVEVKNMNSISNVGRAINFEIKRQAAALEAGEKITQQTRSWDAAKGITVSMRDKESAHDYRYFPEPDLPPLIVSESWKAEIQQSLPELPEALYQKYTQTLGLSAQDAIILTDQKHFALYFNRLINLGVNPKSAANWMLGSVRSWLNTQASVISDFPLSPETLFQLIQLVENNKISLTLAKEKLFPLLTENPERDPLELATDNQWLLQAANDNLEAELLSLIQQFPDKVTAYQQGKTGLLGFFVGQAMQKTGGNLDPKTLNQIITELLSKI
jgi:aspartyl-tRNA(Asn)/glutamyl-tRNA(Gln) amidotransferase subunit B